MYSHPKDVDKELVDITLKLTYLSINNIEWGCLYSGAGIIHTLPEKDIKKTFSNIEIKPELKDVYQNIALLKCLYKKAKPEFTAPSGEVLNPGSYMWDFKSFNKEIAPSTQAFSILSLCNLAELLYDTNRPFGSLLIKNAEIFYDFLSTYLRNDNGLFITVEDKTKFYDVDLKLKPCQKDGKILDQLLVYESMLCLYYITSNGNYKEYFNSKNIKYINEGRNIFNYLYENYNDFLELASKEISLSVSSLVRCCKYERDNQHLVYYNQMIALLCAELESRMKITGEIERNYNDSTVSSLVTHFRTASALLEGFIETGIEKFRDLAARIYEHLENLFDYSLDLYSIGEDSEVSYSIRDIGEIVKSLSLYYIVDKKNKTLDLLIRFFKSAVENSGIVQSLPDKRFNLLNLAVQFPENTPSMSDNNKAPVFMRSFRIIFKKATTCTVSKHYNSHYTLYSSYIFLYYLGLMAKSYITGINPPSDSGFPVDFAANITPKI